MNAAAVLALGFALGLRHASDADHVVAVSTIVARTRRFGAAWLLGAFWGAGHCATICAVGAAIVVFKVTIPPRVGLSLEFAVGLALIALGLLNLAGARLWRAHTHGHEHEGGDMHHSHRHAHWLLPARLRAHFATAGRRRLVLSLGVGLAHGLAGSAAVALLVLATIPTPALGMLYLAVFGAGTLAGMLLLSAAMELTMILAARRFASAGRALTLASGLLSLGFGVYVAYRIGYVDGLFPAAPHWTRR